MLDDLTAVLGSEALAKDFYQLILDKMNAKIISKVAEYPALLSGRYGINQITILQLLLKSYCDAAALELITKFNVDINEADGNGFTPLMYTLKFDNDDDRCFNAIFNHPSIDLLRVNANGETAAQYARKLGFLTHIDSLFEAEKMAIFDRRNPASFFHYCPLDIIKHYLIPMANDRRNGPGK